MHLPIRMLRRRERRTLSVPVSIAAAVLCSFLFERVAAGPDNKEERGFYVWPLWARITVCIVTVLLSAMFCGLTIGLLGIDTVTLEIIASAGAEPERTYARKIIPIRHLGHQLLATLLLGNMLTLVLTSQLVAAIVRSTDLVNFIVGTLVVLVLGEIVPMAYCNKGSNGLRAGVKSLPVLKASVMVLYPIAKPLGMMLDCLISHDAGQLYDKNEIKKLIQVHYEKYADKTGINQDELRMMLSALEMNEVTVDSAMTPLERTLMLEASLPLDTALQRRLWEYGKSRIPVYAGTKSHIIGVLYVKDLINVATLRGDDVGTIRDFIVDHPRDLLVVKEKAQLHDALRIFENHYTQMLFVERVGNYDDRGGGDSAEAGGTRASSVVTEQTWNRFDDEPIGGDGGPLSHRARERPARTLGPAHGGGGVQGHSEATPTSPVYSSAGAASPPQTAVSSSRHYRNDPHPSSTMRKVSFQDEAPSESHAAGGSTDERASSPHGTGAHSLDSNRQQQQQQDHGSRRREWLAAPDTISPRSLLDPDSTNHRVFVGVVTLEDIIERLIASEILDEDEYNVASAGDDSDTNSDVENELLLRSVRRSRSLQKQPIKVPRVNFYSYGLTSGVMEEDDDLTEEQKWALAFYMTRAFVYFASWSVPKVKFLLDEVGDTRVFVSEDATRAYEQHQHAPDGEPAEAAERAEAFSLPPSTVAPARVLYTAGEPSRTFTLLLSGGVDVSICGGQFRTELRSFSSLGEDIFIRPDAFVPDYTAVVSRTSRLISISHEDMYRVERKINAIRRQRGRQPVKITTFDTTSAPLPIAEDLEDYQEGALGITGGAARPPTLGGGLGQVHVDDGPVVGGESSGTRSPPRAGLRLGLPTQQAMELEDRRVGGL